MALWYSGLELERGSEPVFNSTVPELWRWTSHNFYSCLVSSWGASCLEQQSEIGHVSEDHKDTLEDTGVEDVGEKRRKVRAHKRRHSLCPWCRRRAALCNLHRSYLQRDGVTCLL
jgi:hypothetical protein